MYVCVCVCVCLFVCLCVHLYVYILARLGKVRFNLKGIVLLQIREKILYQL